MTQRTSHAVKSARWIIHPDYALRGWKYLPYALQNIHFPHTVFFRENEWKVVRMCDGQTRISAFRLNEEEKMILTRLAQGGYIIPCKEGETLTKEQEYRFYHARFRERVSWAVTGRCNAKCRHCFMSCPDSTYGELSWDEMMKILSSFERCGIKGVDLTGGEPLVRNDFWQLVDEILKRDMVIPVIYTNGLLVNEAFLNELNKRDLHPVIQFSFDGKGCHDWMRGIEGAEEKTLQAIRLCRDHGLITEATMILFRENRNSIRDTVNLLRDAGCYGLKISKASLQGEWLKEKEHDLSDCETYEAFLEYIPHFFEDGMPVSLSLEGMFNYENRTGKFSSWFDKNINPERYAKTAMCAHVRREICVDPKGRVLPCMSLCGTVMEDRFANMLETPLEDILDGSSFYTEAVSYTISDFVNHNPDCAECEYLRQCCGGCRAIALRDHPDDYLARDLSVCEFYKGGWKTKTEKLLNEIRQQLHR